MRHGGVLSHELRFRRCHNSEFRATRKEPVRDLSTDFSAQVVTCNLAFDMGMVDHRSAARQNHSVDLRHKALTPQYCACKSKRRKILRGSRPYHFLASACKQ